MTTSSRELSVISRAIWTPSVAIRSAAPRLRRDVHRQIDLDRSGEVGRHARGRLGDERALPDPRFDQAALAGLAIGAGDCGEVEIKLSRERAVCR